MPERTIKATIECARWLSSCLKIGWKKHQLNMLEELWWEHHDFSGELTKQETPCKK